MKLLLARHADALSGVPDADRRLSGKGEADVPQMARLIQGANWQIDELLHSPITRAQQTAELFAKSLGPNCKVPPQSASFLSPGADLDDSVAHLTKSRAGAALWVFHMPDVATFASYFLGLPPASFYVTPGTILALNISFPLSPGKAMLIWAMQPEGIAPFRGKD
ncbi:MAG: histidine phosphatase family protein [Leptospirales bacterium]|nr:histidine phosphatase family protein [Leptospirales bacterium]